MSWGIAETAPEIEKIKAESADYLGGLNSCGVTEVLRKMIESERE